MKIKLVIFRVSTAIVMAYIRISVGQEMEPLLKTIRVHNRVFARIVEVSYFYFAQELPYFSRSLARKLFCYCPSTVYLSLNLTCTSHTELIRRKKYSDLYFLPVFVCCWSRYQKLNGEVKSNGIDFFNQVTWRKNISTFVTRRVMRYLGQDSTLLSGSTPPYQKTLGCLNISSFWGTQNFSPHPFSLTFLPAKPKKKLLLGNSSNTVWVGIWLHNVKIFIPHTLLLQHLTFLPSLIRGWFLSPANVLSHWYEDKVGRTVSLTSLLTILTMPEHCYLINYCFNINTTYKWC